jgi:transketolase
MTRLEPYTMPVHSSDANVSLDVLRRYATEMRIDIIEMLTLAESGHPGGSLSAIDLITVLFFRHLDRTTQNALDPRRNRFVLSKGHGVPALYAVLAKLGIIEHSELVTLRRVDSRLQGHPHNGSLPYVEASTGSLGQGLSIAQGMAMSAKLDGLDDLRVYCLIGDGEFQEGQIWESLMSSAKFGLDNLVVMLDCNKSQIDGATADVMPIESVEQKVSAFNWTVQRIDGHDLTAIDLAFSAARAREGRPHFIIADTVKGKGVSFMEGNHDWHGKAPKRDEADLALAELRALLNQQTAPTA